MWTFGNDQTKYCAMDMTALQRDVIMQLLRGAISSHNEQHLLGTTVTVIDFKDVVTMDDYNAMRTALYAFENVNIRK